MTRRMHTLLLLALPASGKSELRRYIGSLDARVAEADLGLGPVVQLDDYPYVHMMRRISDEMAAHGAEPAFFPAPSKPFANPWEWGTLMQLLNEDYEGLGSDVGRLDSGAGWLLDRFDAARDKVGIEPVGRDWPIDRVETEAEQLRVELATTLKSWRDDSTVLIEFARGGPQGAPMPLPPPYGYSYSLGQLTPAIRKRASILYVWVTPEQSRRKNLERAQPGRDGDASILFHGVPEEVMLGDYGTDDFTWLVEQGEGDSLAIGGHNMPVAVLDNRDDHTSFLRQDEEDWPADQKEALHRELAEALSRLMN